MYSEPQARWMARHILRESSGILAAQATATGSPFTRSRATFFYPLQDSGLIQAGMATMAAVGPGGALAPGPQRVRCSGILPGFDLLQAVRNRRENAWRLSADENSRQTPKKPKCAPNPIELVMFTCCQEGCFAHSS